MVTTDSITADAVTARPLPDAKPGTREKITYVEQFRAVAILLIVIGHTYELAWREWFGDVLRSGTSTAVVAAMITGGTSLFVFISGFLYRHVFYGRTGYGEFMRKKALVVGVPYLVLALPLCLAQIAFSDMTGAILKNGEIWVQSPFMGVIDMLATGRVMTAYWYIPFIFIVFLASPLFDRFIALPPLAKISVWGVSLAIALWIHRPEFNLDPVWSFFYFANFYLFGILACEQRKALIAWVRRPDALALLALAVVVIAIVQGIVLKDASNLERTPADGWLPLGFDWMLVQKYVLILFACGVLARWGDFAAAPLSWIAGISFGLFFIHGPVIQALVHVPETWFPNVGHPLGSLAVYGLAVIAISMLIVVTIQAIAGRYSRYIVGC